MKLKYIVDPITGCHLWTGELSDNGYARFKRQGKWVKVHREMCKIHHGLASHQKALHTCDVRRCINPEHLYPGSHRDNVRDAVTRHRTICGEKHRSAKLTEQQVRAIITSKERGVDLAERFGVKPPIISKIRRGQKWQRVSGTLGATLPRKNGKITPEIRTAILRSSEPATALAVRYGISAGSVYLVRSKR